MLREFFINLENQENRKSRMEHKFPNAKRLIATEGREADYRSILPYSVDLDWWCPVKDTTITQSQVGRTLSHSNAWKTCLDLNKPILILEDDTSLKDEDYALKIEDALQSHDFVFAGVKKGVEGLLDPFAYAINPEVAKDLVKYIEVNPLIPLGDLIAAVLGVHKWPHLNLKNDWAIKDFEETLFTTRLPEDSISPIWEEEKIKIVSFRNYKFDARGKDWGATYHLVMEAFHKRGYEVRVDAELKVQDGLPSFAKAMSPLKDEGVIIYNHVSFNDIVNNNSEFIKGDALLIIKPTGPSPDCFSLDPFGYGASCSITYDEPDYLKTEVGEFFEEVAKPLIDNRVNKWSNRAYSVDRNLEAKLPEDFTLFVGQMTGDTSVTSNSFGDHWAKMSAILNSLLATTSYPVVVKLHPCLFDPKKEGRNVEEKAYCRRSIEDFKQKGVVFVEGLTSIYEVLPQARVVILENSTAGIETLLYRKPLISFGYPEYHWATKDLRHLNQLQGLIKDLDWYDQEKSDKFVCWYYHNYLCKNLKDVYRQMDKHLN
jgi:GR25 family glycosyltransferase involved in LPS biosynthesis